MLLRNALRYADRPAFVCGDRSLSHGEFLASAHRLASALHAAGVDRQDRVAVLSMNSLELATVYGACELHGFVAATVNFRLAPMEMRHIISDSGAKVLVFESVFTDQIAAILRRADLLIQEMHPRIAHLPGIGGISTIGADKIVIAVDPDGLFALARQAAVFGLRAHEERVREGLF